MENRHPLKQAKKHRVEQKRQKVQRGRLGQLKRVWVGQYTPRQTLKVQFPLKLQVLAKVILINININIYQIIHMSDQIK